MITALRFLLLQILDIYWWIIIAAVIASWLVGFGIINAYNPIARTILRTLHALTEPVFGPVRRVIPAIGGLDISPLIVLLLLTFLRNWLAIGTFF
jgi:YggT family protein